MFKVKIDLADTVFSLAVRTRDGWTCVRCGRVFHGKARRNLDCSHFWGRGRENTRFDPENCDALCKIPCHPLWEKDERNDYEAFKIKQLGQAGFDVLRVRAYTYKKKDRKMRLIEAREYLKQVQDENHE